MSNSKSRNSTELGSRPCRMHEEVTSSSESSCAKKFTRSNIRTRSSASRHAKPDVDGKNRSPISAPARNVWKEDDRHLLPCMGLKPNKATVGSTKPSASTRGKKPVDFDDKRKRFSSSKKAHTQAEPSREEDRQQAGVKKPVDNKAKRTISSFPVEKEKPCKASKKAQFHPSKPISKKGDLIKTETGQLIQTSSTKKARIEDNPNLDMHRDGLPKRKASLDAHSAMLALTLQMQRPILKSTDTISVLRNRSHSFPSPGITGPTSPKSPKKSPSKMDCKKSSPQKPDTKPKYQDFSPKYTLQCTCQSPPSCPVHYQLQCPCHYHHRLMTAATSAGPIFPFPNQPPQLDVMGGVHTQPAHFPHQPPPGAWSTSAPWPFPTNAHMLATVSTPVQSINNQSSNGLSGIPALFQGHLFIRPMVSPALAHNSSVFVGASGPYQTFENPPSADCSYTSGRSLETKICAQQVAEMTNGQTEIVELCTDLSPIAMKPKSGDNKAPKRSASNLVGTATKPKRQKRSKNVDPEPMITPVSSWEPVGDPIPKRVYIGNGGNLIKLDCYEAIRHKREGQIIRIRDCILVNSGDQSDRPYVAKISNFFYTDEGSLEASLVWFYYPGQATVKSIDDRFMLDHAHPQELLFSRHIDCISVDCIEDIAYVLTFNEYNRHIAENVSDALEYPKREKVARAFDEYPRRRFLPTEDADQSLVFFTRWVYDFHRKRIIRKPSQ